MNRGRPKSFDDTDALERAMAVFWKSGYDAASLTDLLSAMAIPRQSLYQTFGNKRTLFLSALNLYGNRMNMAISGILQADRPASENIDELFNFWNDRLTPSDGNGCMMQNTCGQSIMKDQEVAAVVTSHQKKMTEALKQALQQGQQEGSINTAIDARAAARTILTSINGLFGFSRMGLPAEFRCEVIKTLRSLIAAVESQSTK